MAQQNDSQGTPENAPDNQGAANTPAETPAGPPADEDDDARLLREAKEAAEKERNPGPEEQPEEPGAAAPGAAGAAGAAPAEGEQPEGSQGNQPEAGKPQQMVPLARLNDVLGKIDELRLHNANLAGQVAALSRQPAAQPGNGQGQPKQLTPEERLEQIDAETAALDGKFFRGEIDDAQYQRDKAVLRKEERTLLFQGAAAAAAPARPATDSQGEDDLYLDQLTARLEGQHPYSRHIKRDEDWNYIETRARADLAKEGIRLGGDRRSTLFLRTRMAELATELGPVLVGPLPAAGNQPSTQPPNSNGKPLAQARADKLALRDDHPADLRAAGSGGENSDAVTKDRVAGMTDDEILALPKATRQRLFPTVAGP